MISNATLRSLAGEHARLSASRLIRYGVCDSNDDHDQPQSERALALLDKLMLHATNSITSDGT